MPGGFVYPGTIWVLFEKLNNCRVFRSVMQILGGFVHPRTSFDLILKILTIQSASLFSGPDGDVAFKS